MIRLRDEARRQRERFELYKDSDDEWLRRKVHHELDRFLMEHRDTAITLMTEGLERATKSNKNTAPRTKWWRKIVRP